MRASFGLMLLVLATAGCGADAGDGDASVRAPRSDAITSETAARRTVLFVGTSLTAGLGLEPEESYPALVGQRIDSLGLNYEVVNAGVSGETSAGTLRRIDWVLRDPVEVLVLETGANDGLRGLAVDSMRANIQAVLDKVRERRPEARVVLVGMEAPPNLGTRYTSEFRSVFPDLARVNGATLVPFLLDGVAGVTELNQGDGIHPNPGGAKVVTENVWRVLGPLLAVPADSVPDAACRECT